MKFLYLTFIFKTLLSSSKIYRSTAFISSEKSNKKSAHNRDKIIMMMDTFPNLEIRDNIYHFDEVTSTMDKVNIHFYYYS